MSIIELPDVKIIEVEVRTVYGVETVYPSNETARTFAAIAGTKTLKHETLQLAGRLGYTVVVAPTAGQRVVASRFGGAR